MAMGSTNLERIRILISDIISFTELLLKIITLMGNEMQKYGPQAKIDPAAEGK
jgi:hypothetical protein